MSSVIYCITNIINDKQYVGQSVIKNKRWKDHKSALNVGKHSNKHLQSSYNKYGKDKFIYTVLEKVSIEFLDYREQFWIDKLNTVTPNGYNLNPTAGSARGFKHSEETKLKWSEQRKGKKRSAEFSKQLSLRTKGIKRSEASKEKMRLAQLGSIKSDITKAKHSIRMLGNTHNNGKKRTIPMTDETKARIGEAKAELAHKRRREAKAELDNL